jgi:hypothetical protein
MQIENNHNTLNLKVKLFMNKSNERVYRLYGLTRDEIALIEVSDKPS